MVFFHLILVRDARDSFSLLMALMSTSVLEDEITDICNQYITSNMAFARDYLELEPGLF